MRKKGIILIISFFVSINFFGGDNKSYEKVEIFNQALHLIQSQYVEKVDLEKLFYGAIKGMLKELDPYSHFMTPKEYEEMKIATEGKYGGIGIVVGIRDEYLTVISPIEDTPAYRAGIATGDKILKINGESTMDLDLQQAVNKLRGKPETQVTISIYRKGELELIDYTLTREIIKPYQVKGKLLEENIGYIRIIDFSKETPSELEKVMQDLEKNKLKGYILDLRDNPGGLLESAVEVVQKFIGKDKLIVYTEGRSPLQKRRYFAKNKPSHVQLPLVILINEGSASGAEIVAAAIQDWDRGILLGTKTFGKASVQTVLTLLDNSAIRLTTAYYYTPKGRLIHNKGITPDIVVEVPKEWMKELREQKDLLIKKKEMKKILPLSLEEKRKEKEKAFLEKAKEKEEKKQEEIIDLQLQRALDSLKDYEILKKRFEILE